jgi:hypothetical protein
MSTLNTEPNIANPDDFYARLLAAHEGKSKDESDALNARLVLILSNHIGDRQVLEQALALADAKERNDL